MQIGNFQLKSKHNPTKCGEKIKHQLKLYDGGGPCLNKGKLK